MHVLHVTTTAAPRAHRKSPSPTFSFFPCADELGDTHPEAFIHTYNTGTAFTFHISHTDAWIQAECTSSTVSQCIGSENIYSCSIDRDRNAIRSLALYGQR